MEVNKDCVYCNEDGRREKLMIEICKIEVSTVYLFREQTYSGRCNVVFDGHRKELFDLSKEELSAFMMDVSRVAQAITRAFSPDKLNYGAFGDTMPHLHMHVVPKYKDKENWGSTFVMNPAQVYLSDEEYSAMITKIKANL
jgi:diadenosine tetraphosphate (Ap4A) HIT family hydrolase